MDIKICSECGTENENEYLYCKNCGAPLTSAKNEDTNNFSGTVQSEASSGYSQPAQIAEPPQSNAAYTPYGIYADCGIDGIPTEDVAFFVGKKSAGIMPKFIKMEITHSKTSWCWPAAILGFIFGPMGAALWFLYRKMYKIGTILLAIGAALTVVTSAMTYNSSPIDFDGIFDAIASGDAELFGNELEQAQTPLDIAASAIDDISGLATCIITGLFGFYAYKEYCVEKIRGFRQSIPDQRYYRMGLASLGGVSGGMLAIGIVCIAVVSNASMAIASLLSGILN